MDSNTLLNISQNMQDLTFILTNKNYDRIGALSNIDQNTIVYKKTMHGSEISFEIYKELNDVAERLWSELTDFKLIWLKETNEYFQICVATDELSYTKKAVTGKSLCEAELSQVNLYNIEINTEDDIARDDYEITTFYDMDDPNKSLIHRILSKVPQYTIKHVDSSLSKIQRSFSIDGTSILDFFNGECAEQFNCLFTFDSTDRSVSVYDLYTVCNDCGERADMSNFTKIDGNGSFTYTCPKCGSHNVKYYGEDTKIFVDNENLTDEVQLETNTDSVKNCFKLVAGDDLMTATARLLNMNGSDYIYYVSDEQKRDMPIELVDKIESYNKLCASYTSEYESLVSQIYEASEKLYYYRNTMMPTIEHSTVTAATEAAKLIVQNLSPVGLSSVTTSTSKSTVESALKNYAKVYVKSGYVKLEINDSNYSYVGTDSNGNHYGSWTGNFKVTNYSDENDIAYSPTITVKVYDSYQDFVEQKIKKSILNNANNDDSIFDVLSIDNLGNFKNALTYYCLNRLKSFYDAVQTALDVLVQTGQGGQNAELYTALYTPYYNKLWACQNEIDVRQRTIDEWQAKYDAAISRQQEIQKILNFENYIGTDLYKLFCCYRREDTYQNDNYISDGLEDQEVIDRAKEFLDVAKKELVKSSTMQHSISTTLYNLLLIPEFKPLLNSFEVGNWIRVRVDGNIFKLRLIQYEISFSSLNTISVQFSDVIKIRDSVSDFESIVKDAQSIATSYSYISKQADAGHKVSVNMDRIVEDGLNSALVNIKSNDREETSFTNHGILCREYDDISDSYSDEQLRITHNILAYTSNGWVSTETALGKHEFIRYDGNAFVKDIGYGLSSKFVQSGYIYGSQIISGDIYSSNYSPTSGSHLDLKNGNLSFGGGKFTYDANKNVLDVKDSTISGGSIDIGNGNFTVNPNGYMTATGGTFNGYINTSNFNGGTINGAIITSIGTYGATTIDGGTISCQSNGSDLNMITIQSPNNQSRIASTYFYTSDLINQTTAIYPWGLTVSEQSSTMDGARHSTAISSTSVSTYMGYIEYCDGMDTSIPNVRWVKDNITSSGTGTNTNTSSITADYALSVGGNGGSSHLIKFSNADTGLLTGATAEYVQAYVANYTNGSDRRLKKNIEKMRDISDIYMELKPVEYKWQDGYINSHKGLQFGLVAQDVEQILIKYHLYNSDLVLRDESIESEKAIHGDVITYKVDKENLHAMHIQMIQSQQKEIEFLKQQNISLDGRIAILEQIVNQLSTQINQTLN